MFWFGSLKKRTDHEIHNLRIQPKDVKDVDQINWYPCSSYVPQKTKPRI